MLFQPVGFIHHQPGFFLINPQVVGNRLVCGDKAGASVDHKQDDIGFINGSKRLLGHGGVDTLFVTADTAGVDNRIDLIAQHAIAVLAVAGEARKVGHQCITRAR